VQIALAWVLRQPGVIAIPKASSERTMRAARCENTWLFSLAHETAEQSPANHLCKIFGLNLLFLIGFRKYTDRGKKLPDTV